MVLEGKRIILRPFKKEDANEYLRIANEKSIKEYVPFASPDNLAETVELIQNYSELDFVNDFYFIIEDKSTHQLIGALLCFRTLSMDLDTSYFIAKNYRGNGFVLEALHVFINYLTKNTPYQSMHFMINNTNTASMKIMEKLGTKTVRKSTQTTSYEYRIKSAN